MADAPRDRSRRSFGPPEVARRVWEIVHREIPDEGIRLTRIRAAWDDIAPRGLAARVWPVSLRGDRLVLHVQDNQWLHELHYARQELLARVDARVPRAGVARIDVFLGAVPPREARGDPPPSREEVALPDTPLAAEPPQETLDALEGVHDDQLREHLTLARRAMGRSRSAHRGS